MSTCVYSRKRLGKTKTGQLVVSAVILAHAYSPTYLSAQGTPFCPSDEPVQVNDDYIPDSEGSWWIIANWCDSSGENRFNVADDYNFVETGTQEPIIMADPSILQVEDWFYITGTSDDPLLAQTANFPIYRTQDFRTFELHMTAFDNDDLGASGQARSGPVLTFLDSNENADQFSGMWAPHLHFNHDTVDVNPLILLAFTAERETDGIVGVYRSLHQVRLKTRHFVDWHDIADPRNQDGPRFQDRRKGFTGHPLHYGYRVNNGLGPVKRDSGLAQGADVFIPSSVIAEDVESGNATIVDDVLVHQRGGGVVTPKTVMSIDPFLFFDVNKTANDQGRLQMLYVMTNGIGDILGDQDTGGNFVASHEMISRLHLDAFGTLRLLGNNRNVHNKIHGKNLDDELTFLDNGIVKASGDEWGRGGVAEAPSAFYSPLTQRYYLTYSRNPAFSSAYQVVYRMTEPNRPFSDLSQAFGDPTSEEHVLLRAQDFSEPNTASFGGAEVFMITDVAGNVHPYLIFHVKLDFEYVDPPDSQVKRRNVFFKEITLEHEASGRLTRIGDGNVDPRGDLTLFRVPVEIGTDGPGIVSYEEGPQGGDSQQGKE